MIQPTVGRIVWFYPKASAAETHQPHSALIAFVHDERTINVQVFNQHKQGINFHEKVQLLQDADDEVPPEQPFCCWMPYQVGQAAKTAEAELAQIAARTAEDVSGLQAENESHG